MFSTESIIQALFRNQMWRYSSRSTNDRIKSQPLDNFSVKNRKESKQAELETGKFCKIKEVMENNKNEIREQKAN